MRHYVKVIRIRAEDSPNVRLAMREQQLGKRPSGRTVVPGVLSWADYKRRRATWDEVRQCVGLDAMFYEGAEILLYPPQWLMASAALARALQGKPRRARGIGVDPAEGGDKTTMAASDELGLVKLKSRKTPDTSVIPGEIVAFMREMDVPPERVCIDRGGGGKQAADVLRRMGFPVRTVAFGEPLVPDPRRGLTPVADRQENKEERYTYVNRRAQMFGEFSVALDPHGEGLETEWGLLRGYAIPEHVGPDYQELTRQLAVIPRLYDGEGRMYMLPKNKPRPDSKVKTLVELIGHSPDEADAVVLSLHAMVHRGKVAVAGAV